MRQLTNGEKKVITESLEEIKDLKEKVIGSLKRLKINQHDVDTINMNLKYIEGELGRIYEVLTSR